MQTKGVDAWHAAAAAPLCAVTWRAVELTGSLDQLGTELAPARHGDTNERVTAGNRDQ